jgi:hypothetical protein
LWRWTRLGADRDGRPGATITVEQSVQALVQTLAQVSAEDGGHLLHRNGHRLDG